MKILGSFKKASRVIDDAKQDVRKKPKDEVGERRQQKNSGGKK